MATHPMITAEGIHGSLTTWQNADGRWGGSVTFEHKDDSYRGKALIDGKTFPLPDAFDSEARALREAAQFAQQQIADDGG